jgi:hypothetical protein
MKTRELQLVKSKLDISTFTVNALHGGHVGFDPQLTHFFSQHSLHSNCYRSVMNEPKRTFSPQTASERRALNAEDAALTYEQAPVPAYVESYNVFDAVF